MLVFSSLGSVVHLPASSARTLLPFQVQQLRVRHHLLHDIADVRRTAGL